MITFETHHVEGDEGIHSSAWSDLNPDVDAYHKTGRLGPRRAARAVTRASTPQSPPAETGIPDSPEERTKKSLEFVRAAKEALHGTIAPNVGEIATGQQAQVEQLTLPL